MNDLFAARAGAVVSADIAVPEHAKEVAFYAAILATGTEPLWRDDLMNNRGMPVIGLGERTPDYADLPLQWMPHIQVADVAQSAERAVSLGGREVMHGKDDAGNSQWAVLMDLQGAAFGVIPVVAEEAMPADLGGPLGCIAGLSLTVEDAEGLRAYYQQVVGWSADEAATLVRREQAARDGMPGVWLLHLPVGDLGASLANAVAAGGAVLWRLEGQAAIADPIGVQLMLVQA